VRCVALDPGGEPLELGHLERKTLHRLRCGAAIACLSVLARAAGRWRQATSSPAEAPTTEAFCVKPAAGSGADKAPAALADGAPSFSLDPPASGHRLRAADSPPPHTRSIGRAERGRIDAPSERRAAAARGARAAAAAAAATERIALDGPYCG
jgi:hypothetical protein